MKVLFFIALSLLNLHAVQAQDNPPNSCPTSNGYIESNVNVDAKASMLHTVSHHWKFEFWRGAVCWGSPDDHYRDSQEYKNSSNKCTGKMNFATDRGNQMNYVPMSLSWGANLTDGDTFTLELDDQRVRAVYGGRDSECTSHRMSTKLDYASVTYNTRAVINVPADVWIVQIRASANVTNTEVGVQLNPMIGRKVLTNPENPTKHFISLSSREWTYLYVEPNEPLELTLAYNEQGLDFHAKYNVKYDFKFIGHNRCTEVLGSPKNFDYTQANLRKTVFTPLESEADIHSFAVKLGCLRNPAFLKTAMNNSRPDSLEPALLTIEGEAKKILERPWEAKQKEYGAPFLSTILDMSLVDISRFALNDLHKYCQSYRNFTRETAVSEDVTEVAGVEFMMMTYYHLDKIYQQLARESLSVLVDRVEALNKAGATYAELYNGQPDVQKALRAYKHQMVQSGLEIYATLIQELQKIPQPEIGRTHLDHVFKDLNDANSLAQRVRLATQQMLRDFGRRSTSIVNVGELKSSVQALLLLDQRIHSQLNEYFDWFVSRGKDGKLGDAFVQALITMEKKILLPSAANLERIAKSQNLRSLNEQFVRRKDLDEISRKIGACIFQPYGEQK